MDMPRAEIGDVMLEAQGPLLRVTIAEQQSSTTWTVAGAKHAIRYLRTWVQACEMEAWATDWGASAPQRTEEG